MTIETLEDGYVRITNPGGKVLDTRTRRRYRVAVVKAELARFFAAA